MKHTRTLTAILGATLASTGLAQESTISHLGVIQAEYSNAEQSGVTDSDIKLLFGTYYLQEVNHGDLPHTQAAFLERAASLSAVWADFDTRLIPLRLNTSGDVGGFDAQYITESHWVIGGGYSRFDIARISDQKSHNIEVGRYLNDTSRLLFTYANADTDAVFTPDTETKTWGVEYKNVTVHPSMTTALTLDMKYNHIDDDLGGTSNLYGVQGEYHFALATSLVAGVELTTGNNEGEKYNLGVMQFLTRYFALGAEMSRLSPDVGKDTKTWTVRARLLF